jgi:hypothetical protein
MRGQHHAPATFNPGKEPVPIVQEAGWAPEPIWIGAENLVPPGFDPRTFQPVVSRYTDYAIPAPYTRIYLKPHLIPPIVLYGWENSSVVAKEVHIEALRVLSSPNTARPIRTRK